MPFDVGAARKAGYSDDEILQHLTETRQFDIQGAIKSGYSKPEIIDHLASTEGASATPRPPVSETASGHLASMQSGPAKAQFEQAQASATQDIKNLTSRAVGEAAAMAPFAAAAPLTGGTSLPLGAAIMGGAGLLGGLAREGVKSVMGSSEVPKGKELALALGVDTAAGVGGEMLGRGLMLGKTLLPKILTRVAVRSEAGKAAVQTEFTNLRNELYQEINNAAIPKAAPNAVIPFGQTQTGSVFVDVERPLREAYAKIAQLPRAKGSFLGGETKLTPEAGQIIRDIENDLHLQVGIGQLQPLDGLVRAKGNFQQKVFESTTLNTEEREVFQKLAADLHDIIKNETKALGPQVAALYDRVNELGITLNKATVAKTIAEKFVNTYTGRAAIGASVGGSEGYRRGGPGTAAIGAAVGAGAGLATPRLAALILQQTMAHPKAAQMMSRALDLAINGKNYNAKEVAGRAFTMAGVRETLKDAMRQTPEMQEFAPPAPAQ